MTPRTDTSIDARRRQLEAYRAMTPARRLHLAATMSEDVRTLARAGIRARHGGDMTDESVNAVLARIILGDELAAAVAAAQTNRRR